MATHRGTSRQRQAEGRGETAEVRRYLEPLERHKPKRERKRTPQSIRKRTEAIDQKLDDASQLQRLQLTQKRMDLEDELARLEFLRLVKRV